LLIILILSIIEGLILLLVRNPNIIEKCPQQIRNNIGYYYVRERPTIQFETACARHDPSLGYTLKPGSCNFGGLEFDNRYNINSAGVRDTEESLKQPAIVVIGDSFAMGWGVNQEETFAKILEKKTGMKVLNTAISSYGTVREMMILNRIAPDHMKYLIIQYCGNDLEENRESYLKKNHLVTMTADEYRSRQNYYSTSRQYYFGKYIWMKVKKRWDEIGQRREKKKQELGGLDKDEEDLFLNALINGGVDLTKVQIITFVMNGRNPLDNKDFPSKLKKKLAAGNYPPYLRNMIVLDFSDQLKKQHFYVLDDHLNAAGNMIIADTLTKTIETGQEFRLQNQ